MTLETKGEVPSEASEDEDLICDAIEAGDSDQKGTDSFRGCLRSCCPVVINALNDLRKVKVAEVVSKKAANSLSAAVVAPKDVMDAASRLATGGNAVPEQEIETVIERLEDVRKPRLDNYSYRYLELRNGLKVMLASDPKCKSSAAALDIKIGSFHDPVHLQGLAHLCEHVLFTGSELFPSESYSAFLGQRGGSSNAFTTSEHTNFHFEVPSEHFLDALKRFVSFFQCPILREASIQNELEIIQSEHEKNRWNDVWRTNQVERATANPFHVFSHFSTGTRQTLTVEKGAERSLRYELFQFYRCNYSANIMCLCLIHNTGLDEMEEVAKTYLLGLPNRNLPERIWPNRPFRPKQMRTKVYVVPVKEMCHVNLTFPMEDLSPYYSSAPAGQVAQLIGHKGEGGLYALLRAKGWSHQLVASHKTLAKGFSLFMISIQLTEAGEKFIDEAVLNVFQYIKLLQETGPLQWFHDELRYLSEQQFQQRDKERPQNYASNVALWLHMYPALEVLSADYLIHDWRPDLIERVYAYLSPDNVRVTILTKKAKFFASHVEPHFGTEYHVEKIDPNVLQSWHQCGANADLRVPRPNDFIDKDPELIAAPDENRQMPELFLNVERIRLRAWHMPDTKLKIPRAFTFLKFYCTSKWSVKSSCLNHLFAFVVRDCLSEAAYKAQLAGMFYILRPLRNGLELEVRGLSGKQHLFLEKILQVIFDCAFNNEILSEDRFNQVHSLHLNGLHSGDASKLKILAKNILSHVLCPDYHLRDARLRAMSQITVEDLREHAKTFLLHHSLEALFYGNLAISTANKMADTIILSRRDFLEKYSSLEQEDPKEEAEEEESNELLLEDWFKNDPTNRIAMLEKTLVEASEDGSPVQALEYSLPKCQEALNEHKQHVVIIENEVQSSSCVLYYLECSKNEPAESAKLELFFHLVQVKLITAMKHVVPLGYVVGCDIRKVKSRLGFRITVESQYPLGLVYKTIEDALEDIDDFLAAMTPEEFDMSKAAVMSVKREAVLSMRDQAHQMWREIAEESYHFNRHSKELSCMNQLDLLSIRTFYRDHIHSKASERRCLVVSIGPDPILNRLEIPPALNIGVLHWTQSQIDEFRRDYMSDIPAKAVPKEWFQAVFDNSDFFYNPPFFGEDQA